MGPLLSYIKKCNFSYYVRNYIRVKSKRKLKTFILLSILKGLFLVVNLDLL